MGRGRDDAELNVEIVDVTPGGPPPPEIAHPAPPPRRAALLIATIAALLFAAVAGTGYATDRRSALPAPPAPMRTGPPRIGPDNCPQGAFCWQGDTVVRPPVACQGVPGPGGGTFTIQVDRQTGIVVCEVSVTPVGPAPGGSSPGK